MFQHLQMLGNRRHAHGEGLGQFGHRRFTPHQPRKNGAAGRIGKSGEFAAERIHDSFI